MKISKQGPKLLAACMLLVLSRGLEAGPPFLTDDPETLEKRHGEFYLASQAHWSRSSKDITLPHGEVNYGLMSDFQLHLIMPLHHVQEEGERKQYGYGDTEFGVKFRFLKESSYIPMAGIFPLVEIPTGDKEKGLGNGKAQYLLPLWLQKRWGRWSSYGGGGYWINPGEGNKNYWVCGWQGQYDFLPALSLGAEVFYSGPGEEDGESLTVFNLGAVLNFGEAHHLLLSAGRSLRGPKGYLAFIAYQLTAGWTDRKGSDE